MTTIAPSTVVTAILGHEFYYARTPEETADLVEAVLDTRYSQLYVWDRPCLSSDDGGPQFPGGHRMKITSRDGWGALNYMDARPGTGEQGRLVDSYNPYATGETPSLLFDPEGDLWFPASASLPLDQVREAIAEYCRTGQRPESVRWQPGQWY
ncbi:Imm1 family immunity protein [Actinopolyspora sp. H202]|uniref:Imm1 family immunity protein n=1 Tax=Actinopolyspora sp. H202 TaxID=1500456 RepID=UPI003EE665B8